MDGYELVREMRHRDRTASLPAIALTGHGRAEDVKKAFAAGFLAHVDKPVDFEHMKSVIATVMGGARASRNWYSSPSALTQFAVHAEQRPCAIVRPTGSGGR
jgi:CheY-like chemotaxis protein